MPDISAEQDILIVEDAACDERFFAPANINEQDKITFYAGMPLVNDDGVIMGSTERDRPAAEKPDS